MTSKHRVFIDIKADPSCLTAVMLQLILLYARHVLSEIVDIGSGEEISSSAKLYLKAMEVSEVQKRLVMPQVLEGLLPMQTLPPHVLHHLSIYYGEEGLL